MADEAHISPGSADAETDVLVDVHLNIALVKCGLCEKETTGYIGSILTVARGDILSVGVECRHCGGHFIWTSSPIAVEVINGTSN